MYKLTVIAGPNRGSSFPAQDEVTIGRQTGNTIVLSSSKVSKRHCSIQVTPTDVILKDLGSSNGTFVNGILTKQKKIKPGDRISVGEFVLELVEPAKKTIKAVPAAAGLGIELQFPSNPVISGRPISGFPGSPGLPGAATPAPSNQPPKDLKGKVIWYFENQLMPIFYNLNLKNEWNVICVGLFGVFILGNLVISVYPLIESGRATVVKETARRARFMARQIADQNAPYLAARAETKTEIGMAENAEGVRVAILIDLDNRIIAPGVKLNQYFTSGPEALYAVKSREAFLSGEERGAVYQADDSTVVAVEPVKVLSPTAGKNVVVAMAIVSIDTSISTPDLGEMGIAYSETLIFTGLLGGVILFILYRLTLKPLQVLNDDMDKALKGDLNQVTHQFKFKELNPLWELINSAIQRIPKSESNTSNNVLGAGPDPSVIEQFIGPMRTIGGLVKFGLAVFDAEKKIVYINPVFEEISGIRQDGAIGREISEVARDQSMAIFTTDILERAPVGGEGGSEDFDFSGISYRMHAGAFGNPSGSAKCYFLAAVRVES